MPCVAPVASAEALIDVTWAQSSEYVAPTLKQGLRKWERYSEMEKRKYMQSCTDFLFYFIEKNKA